MGDLSPAVGGKKVGSIAGRGSPRQGRGESEAFSQGPSL